MENLNWLELFGYAASAITAISLTMSSVVKLRWVNLLGSSLFCVYGLLIGSMPVALMNLFIAGVNVYFLTKIYTEKQHFRLLETSAGDTYLKEFLELNKKDIKKYFPEFGLSAKHDFTLMVHRELALAGVLVGRWNGAKEIQMDLDFVLPQYRDLKAGNYLFHENRSYFLGKGIRKITTVPGSSEHAHYLKKVGFQKVDNAMVLSIE